LLCVASLPFLFSLKKLLNISLLVGGTLRACFYQCCKPTKHVETTIGYLCGCEPVIPEAEDEEKSKARGTVPAGPLLGAGALSGGSTPGAAPAGMLPPGPGT
jgi:hypothetical protein